LQIIEDIWQNRDRDYNVRCLVKRLQRIDKEMSGYARIEFASYVEDGDVSRFAKTLPAALSRDFTSTIKLLRNDGFQDLLVNYERARSPFVIAEEVEDIVGSEWLIRGAAGKEYKPEDYITAFAEYVRANPEKIQAIQILLNRPKDWGTDALTELRQKLAVTPERFTVDNLRKAHTAQYGKALVEIISMVKHAADALEPLLTAEERVDRAVTKITAGRTLTEEQQRWMDRIREHMITNLSISQDDFDLMPIFNREGGWGRANRVFEGKLNELIKELNEAIAA
jgi:type I restriction enzyme R subunit